MRVITVRHQHYEFRVNSGYLIHWTYRSDFLFGCVKKYVLGSYAHTPDVAYVIYDTIWEHTYPVIINFDQMYEFKINRVSIKRMIQLLDHILNRDYGD